MKKQQTVELNFLERQNKETQPLNHKKLKTCMQFTNPEYFVFYIYNLRQPCRKNRNSPCIPAAVLGCGSKGDLSFVGYSEHLMLKASGSERAESPPAVQDRLCNTFYYNAYL